MALPGQSTGRKAAPGPDEGVGSTSSRAQLATNFQTEKSER